MSNERERRCTDCGAQVSDEHIALATETGQAPYCPDCWSESVVWAEGVELAALSQWAAYIQERRLHYNGGFGDEPTVICDGCSKRIEAADAGNSLFNGKRVSGRCAGLESEAGNG